VAGTAPVPAGQNQRHTKNSTELGKRQIVLVPLGTNTGPKKKKRTNKMENNKAADTTTKAKSSLGEHG